MKFIIKIIVLIISITIFSCVEKYEPKTSTFETILIVEATLTNQNIKHQIKLSRTIPIDSIIPNSENNALVKVKVSNGNEYNFTEIEAGLYESNDIFKVEPNLDYKLIIDTENGENYVSSQEQLTPIDPITNLYAKKNSIDNPEGISIYIDSQNNMNAKYFKYEYEETNKIISPFWVEKDIEIINDLYYTNNQYDFLITPSLIEKRICFNTNQQTEIILFNNNTNIKTKIRFINADSPIIRERYSILVKQYVLNSDAYHFLKKMKDFSSQQSLFSALQTGFIKGNIKSEKKVLGFFNVTSFSEKRIFFNYYDFNFEKPSYQYDCIKRTLSYYETGGIDKINEREAIYNLLNINKPPYELRAELGDRLFILVNPQCGNCNNFASNIRPEFWID